MYFVEEGCANEAEEPAVVEGYGASGGAALVVNARSRSGGRVFEAACERLGNLGVPLGSATAIHDPVRLPEAVREAVADGYGLVILGGGDGSVSSVVDFLADKEVTLGLLPLGTANDFARTLDIPAGVQEACETVAHGKVVDVDLGLTGDNYYVNVASVGLSAGVTEALTPRLKKTAGALAYGVAALGALSRHEPFAARLEFPEGDHAPVNHERLLQVAVGNGRFYGGGLVVAPDSGIDDRNLDVYTIEMGRYRDLLRVARHLRSGDFVRQKGVNHYRTPRLCLETRPELRVNVDGELVARTPQEFSVAPNALRVIVPQKSSAARHDR